MPKKINDFVAGQTNPAHALKGKEKHDYPGLPQLATYLKFVGGGTEQLHSTLIASDTLQLIAKNSDAWGSRIPDTFKQLKFKMARISERFDDYPGGSFLRNF